MSKIENPETLIFGTHIKSDITLKEWQEDEEDAEEKAPSHVIAMADFIIGNHTPKLTYFVVDGDGEWKNSVYPLYGNALLVISEYFIDDDMKKGKWSILELEESIYF